MDLIIGQVVFRFFSKDLYSQVQIIIRKVSGLVKTEIMKTLPLAQTLMTH